MIIQTKKDLRFYILADRVMNGMPVKISIKERLLNKFFWGVFVCYETLRLLYEYNT